MTELVQEVISRNNASWTSSSPLAFLISGTGKRKAESYDDDDSRKNPYLYIEYTTDTASVSYAPEVFLTAPEDGVEFTSLDTIDLTAIAFDADHGISKVEFYVDGNKVGEDTSVPYAYAWVPGSYDTYVIKATAVDQDGNTTDSETATIEVTDPSQTTVFEVRIDDDHFDCDNAEVFCCHSL